MNRMFLCIMLCHAICAAVTDGTLDPSFGTNGQVLTPIASTATAQIPRNIRIQTDGKILVGGRNSTSIGGPCIFINRYNLDGTLDDSYGINGRIQQCLPGGTVYAADMVLQPDNKAVVGILTPFAGNDTIVLARFLTDGSLDVSFGVNGFAELIVATPGTGRQLLALAIQTDGSIVAATTTSAGFLGGDGSIVTGPGPSEGVVARFLPDGAVDTSFGTNGFILINAANYGGTALAFFGIQIQHDGKIVAFGDMSTTLVSDLFFIARLLTDGTLDPDFGVDGVVITNAGTGAAGGIIQSDGKILACGAQGMPPLIVVRYLPNGTLDQTFAENGIGLYTLAGNISNMNCIVLQSDGKIIVSNSFDDTTNPNGLRFTTLRINTNGSIDKTFGTNGYVNTFVLNQPNCQTFGCEVDTHGDIYVIGTVGNIQIGLVKYIVDSITYGPLSNALAQRYYNQNS